MGSFNSKKQLGFKPEDYQLTDFTWDHPLRMIAEIDMSVALDIIGRYGCVNI